MHENVISGAGCWGMKQVGRGSSWGGDRLVIVGPSLMGSGGGWGACSDGTGMKQAALPFMNKCKHDTM